MYNKRPSKPAAGAKLYYLAPRLFESEVTTQKDPAIGNRAYWDLPRTSHSASSVLYSGWV